MKLKKSLTVHAELVSKPVRKKKKKRFLRAHKEPQLKRETKKIKLGRVRIRCELRGFSGVEWMSGELLSWRL